MIRLVKHQKCTITPHNWWGLRKGTLHVIPQREKLKLAQLLKINKMKADEKKKKETKTHTWNLLSDINP